MTSDITNSATRTVPLSNFNQGKRKSIERNSNIFRFSQPTVPTSRSSWSWRFVIIIYDHQPLYIIQTHPSQKNIKKCISLILSKMVTRISFLLSSNNQKSSFFFQATSFFTTFYRQLQTERKAECHCDLKHLSFFPSFSTINITYSPLKCH